MSAQYAVLLNQSSALAIAREDKFPTPFLVGTGPRGEKGDPGGNIMAIGLFTDASGLSIPLGTDAVRTSGRTVTGLGIADYAWDEAVDAAYVASHPTTSFISTNGRGFRYAGSGLAGILEPEAFGADEAGTAEGNTLAFQALSVQINADDGGVIALKAGATYAVGLQTLVNAGGVMWKGQSVVHIHDCTKPVTIIANGAKLKLADGLKYGTFNSSGVATTHTQPYTGGDASTVTDPATGGVITFENNSGPIRIVGPLELDGNLNSLDIGGPWAGDSSGYQLAGDGLVLFNNTGGFYGIVNAHDFPRDGMLGWGSGVTGNEPPLEPHVFGPGSRFTKNGRNGASVLGGRGWAFEHGLFTGNGKTDLPLRSGPSCGIDIEVESGSIRDVTLTDCILADNGSTTINVATGDIAGVHLVRCQLDSHSAWAGVLQKPGIVLEDCKSYGPFNIGAAAPANAIRFVRHTFSDAVADSYAGVIGDWTSLGIGGGLALAFGNRAIFDSCTWNAGNKMHAVNISESTFINSTINVLTGFNSGFTNCVWIGRNEINAPDITSVPGTFVGSSIILNGSPIATGFGYSAGDGGTVTQATDKATGVTLNKVCGQIIMNAASLAANTSVAFNLTNPKLAATDVIILNIADGATANSYLAQVEAISSSGGVARIQLRNITAGPLSEAVKLNFAIIKAVNA